MSDLYTTTEVARLLQMDGSTIAKWVDKGFITAFRTPGGHRRVRASDLRAFLIANEMPIPKDLGSDHVELLVVDDERAILDSVKRSFKKYPQVHITTTSSSVEALLILAENKPHGVLLDLNLPEMDGYEVCRAITTRKSLQGVKVIVFTGRATDDVVHKALKAGAVACLPKPLDINKVVELFKLPIALSKAG
jgi:excisionase family DNA binding protein